MDREQAGQHGSKQGQGASKCGTAWGEATMNGLRAKTGGLSLCVCQ